MNKTRQVELIGDLDPETEISKHRRGNRKPNDAAKKRRVKNKRERQARKKARK